jgi:hypothetical protein
VSDQGPFDADPGRQGAGRHRAERTSDRPVLARILAPVVAVALVAGAIAVLVAVRGHSAGSGVGPGVVAAPTGTHRTPSVSSPSTSSTPSVTLTHPPPTLFPTPHKTHRHPPASRTAMAPVRVYNTTHISQLAHRVAAEIAAKGWTVPDVGNMGAVSSSTTLYYSPNNHAAARHLAREFSGIRRIRPNSEAAINYNGLTLLITADWHD